MGIAGFLVEFWVIGDAAPGPALTAVEVVAIAAMLGVVGVVAWRVLRPPQLPPRNTGAELAGETRREPAAAPTARQAGPRQPGKREEEKAFLHAGLAKTRQDGFVTRLTSLFAGKQIDAGVLEAMEEVLLRADLGAKTTANLLTMLRESAKRDKQVDPAAVWAALRKRTAELLLATGNAPLASQVGQLPAVWMVVGVNGSGKTTTIGKLAHRYAAEGKKVLVAAGDTYRAAAVDQLEVWCQRAGVPLHRGKDNADPASVCFSAIERGKAEGFDLVIVDTAGRLHTNHNLMEELKKVTRVCQKAQSGAPHEVLLVLDATMGQNAVKQAELFREAVQVTGIALTKLDGTAKGGVILAIAETLGLPVKLVGVGEQMADLRDFDAELFIDALFAGTDGAEHPS